MIQIPDPADELEFKQVQSDALARTQAFFSENTPLKEAAKYGGRAYEPRPQQARMAAAVAESLEKNHNLCVEAPTGVGKSFAYLIPAIYHAVSTHKPVLVTTETINLQEQLVRKDLPLLQQLTGLDFTYVIAKGRANYLCKRRLAMAVGEHSQEVLPLESLKSDLDKLEEWAAVTEDGSRADIKFRLDPQIWPCVCSEASNCASAKCAYHKSCFYWQARKQWDKADLIVTNHALFFVDLKIRYLEKQETTPLPAYGAVIFDEAHTLEDNAAKHLGIHVSSSSFRFFLNRLFNPVNGRGLLMKPGESSMAVRALISRIHENASDFFGQFSRQLEDSPEHCFRIAKSGLFQDNLSSHLEELQRVLHDYAEDQEDQTFKLELGSSLDKCVGFREEIKDFIDMLFETHVYWAEGRMGFRSGLQVELASAPLDVADLLRHYLFAGDIPVILTSATLAVKGSLDYYIRRVGFARGSGMILDSPFDYSKQVKLYLAKSMPLPGDRAYNDAAADAIWRFVKFTSGRAFVLFTSFSMLKFCAESLAQDFRQEGISLLVQGESQNRTAMLEEFRHARSAVIFGATSFWTGVDVPGEALSNVIITKLPFAVPSHPLIQARCERIRAEGGEPFTHYSLPDAVLKFRQGVGRLIRSRTDHGIIVILDPRVAAKYYGRLFLNSIPVCPVEYF